MVKPFPLPLFVTALLLAAATGAAQGLGAPPTQASESTGERELKALAAAYPDRIGRAELRDGDWAAAVDGEWFSWAQGRLLPSAQLADRERYARYRFYAYPLGAVPPLRKLDEEAVARLKKSVEESRLHPPRRSEQFLERLLGAAGRKETESRIVSVDFVGHKVQVHRAIAHALRSVAAACDTLRRTDGQAAAFLAGLSRVGGYSYRDVAGTLTRSYHSYGLAVDLIPKSYGGKATYWRWAMEKTEEWWATPYTARWMVPESIISAFEEQGFIWGGKWLYFDTMHFEYRPEIIIMARSLLP